MMANWYRNALSEETSQSPEAELARLRGMLRRLR